MCMKGKYIVTDSWHSSLESSLHGFIIQCVVSHSIQQDQTRASRSVKPSLHDEPRSKYALERAQGPSCLPLEVGEA